MHIRTISVAVEERRCRLVKEEEKSEGAQGNGEVVECKRCQKNLIDHSWKRTLWIFQNTIEGGLLDILLIFIT